MTTTDIIQNQIQKRLVTEGISRIQICLNYLSYEEIWFIHNTNVTSIGSLILHLEGNVRQWLLNTLTDLNYVRQRDKEFTPNEKIVKSELLFKLSKLQSDIEKITIANIDLTKEVSIQGFKESTLGAIIHVIEHFSYHVGQITTLTKIMKNINTAYYDDLDLNIT